MSSKVTKGLSTASPVSKVATKPTMPTKNPSIKSAMMPEMDYKAHDDHRTLMEAEHIKADPSKMMKVRKVAGRKLMAATAINNISDIKAAGKKMRAGSMPKAGADPTEPAKRYPSGDIDQEAEMHYNTLSNAEGIKASPSRMAAVGKVAGAKMHAASMVHKMVDPNDRDAE